MASRRQSHALTSFVADVMVPLRERVSQSWRGAPQWARVWSYAEGVEARRLLELGRALEAFDSDEVVGIRKGFSQVLGESLFDSAVNELMGSERTLQLFLLDQAIRSATVAIDGPHDLRDLVRARGIWQSNVLVSSRLGHGLAAEALAQLAFGDASDCLGKLADVSSRKSFSRREEETLTRLLRQPAAAFGHDQTKTRGLELVASMFHAVQYLWSLGYSHEYRQVDIVEAQFRADPLARAIGTTTGDCLHMVQYWRAAFHNDRLEQDFLTALELAGTVWFKVGLMDRQGLESDDVAAFLSDLKFRAVRALRVWCRAFDSLLVGVADGGQGGVAAV